MTVRTACRTQRLSFAKLSGLLPPQRARRFVVTLEEPWDLVVDPPEKLTDGLRKVTYGFQLSAFEPEDLIIEVSRLYPRLCFVIGCVAPSVDAQSSLLVHNGRSRHGAYRPGGRTRSGRSLSQRRRRTMPTRSRWGLLGPTGK